MIIAFQDFRDAEYFIPKEILEKAGAKVTTVSTKLGTAIEGPRCLQHLDNENSYEVARETIEKIKFWDRFVFRQ